MTLEQLQTRLDTFAVAVHGLASPLLDRAPGQNAGHQIIKSSSSMAQNYASTCVARSHREFTAKIGLVLEESTETLKWLHYIEKTRLAAPAQTGDLIQEAAN